MSVFCPHRGQTRVRCLIVCITQEIRIIKIKLPPKSQNNDINESQPCICGTGHDVEVRILDFKYRERIMKMQTMFPKLDKSLLLSSGYLIAKISTAR